MSKKAHYQKKKLYQEAKKCLIIKLKKYLSKKLIKNLKNGALSRNIINPFQTNVLFFIPPEKVEKICFFAVFKGHRKGALA